MPAPQETPPLSADEENLPFVSPASPENTVLAILFALSFSHLLNDTMQSLLPAIYPLLKTSFHLSFTQVGLITLTNQLTASLLQPMVGLYTDRYPKPYSLAVGMGFTLAGIVLLGLATHFALILLAAALVGMGSSVFHPEASRVAWMASGGRHGFAQSLFQVGGNAGTSFGPLLAGLIIVHGGRIKVLWFSLVALAGIALLTQVGHWYRKNTSRLKTPAHASASRARISPRKVFLALAVLVALVFSKYFYLTSMTSYYTFYLIQKFHLSAQSGQPQYFLFIFLFAVAAGTIIGGPLGDRFGRKHVIWASILGVTPFTLLLPYAGLVGAAILTVFIGVILASAFSAIVVYAQELVPGNVGLIAGLFFGLAFGMGGIGSALLGKLADLTSISYVFQICSFLPLIGVLTWFLPDVETKKAA
ncbi:MAG TPA: MFS transporter [Candidatus Methylacidiphilales bacterium]|jgi:FSR family fosmidomycin resistance protein-like MFS transporter|nr:MFS transporter [Candidatus Methylacidiphilales bacterium]